MAVCGLRTLLLIVCVVELIVTIQRQVFDFLGYMWLPIIANFLNILLIIFGSFGAVQYITKYLLAYTIWSFMWLTWNIFLSCYYLNLGSLNRESGLLSLGTGSVSWWEGNGWGCRPVWGEAGAGGEAGAAGGEAGAAGGEAGAWRPARVAGCALHWPLVELAQAAAAALLAAAALPLAALLAHRSFRKRKPDSNKGTLPRRPVYTIELSPTETNVSESSLKPMTPRRVKRRSGSRGAGGSSRRSRRSYRNAAYLASNASLARDARPARPASAHSSYSNFHAARPGSYHAPERDTARAPDVYDPPPPTESVPIMTNRFDTVRRPSKAAGYDVAGPYDEPRGYYDAGTYDSAAGYEGGEAYGAGWQAPPPAPPYSARATPQAPGPPAYQQTSDAY